jgi:hypothetical protein
MSEDLRNIADELAVHRVLAEYCLRLEVSPFEEWLDLFTEDTVYEVFKRTLRGREQVASMLSKAPHGVHLGGPARIEINGEQANTIQNYLFIDSATGKWNMGWYHRTLVRTDKGWKISHTNVKMQKIAPTVPAVP